MENTKKESWKVTYQSVLLVLGLYFFWRVIRNSLYYEWLSPLEAVSPAFHEGLHYLGHLILLGGLFLYFALVKEERVFLKSCVFRKKSLYLMVIGFAAGFLMNGISVLAAYAHGDIDMVVGKFDPLMLIFVFLCIFVQSSTEEFEYRLWTQRRISDRAPLGYAVIGSALAFAFSHMLNAGISPVAVLNLMLIGILYSLAFYYTGDIWFTCAHHAAWNITQNCVFGLPNSGNAAVITIAAPTYTKSSFFYDAEFGVEGTWITSVVCLIVIAVFLLLIRRKNKSVL